MKTYKAKGGVFLTIATTLGGDIRIGINDTYAVLTVKQAKRVCVVVGRQVDKILITKNKV
jgi:hypothetical protein